MKPGTEHYPRRPTLRGDRYPQPLELRRIQHIGISVRDLDRTLAFWEAFLGTPARWRRVLDAGYLGRVTGYAGVRIEAALIDLPGGMALEILGYLMDGRTPNPPDTANPGNVHFCIEVDDADKMWERAVAAGAEARSPGPVDITEGPNAGARSCYLRDPDGITFELYQPKPSTPAPAAPE